MFEDLDDVSPPSPPTGLREAVVAEAHHRRFRRRALAGGAAAAAVLASAAVVAAAPSSHPHVHVSSQATTSSSEVGQETTTSGVPGSEAATSTTTAAPGAVGGSPATSTGLHGSTRHPSTTAPPPSVTTSVATFAGSKCMSADLVVTATTDKSSYAPGETVTITVREQNRSDRRCQARRAHMGGQYASVHDSGGATLWTQPVGPRGVETMDPDPVLDPGQSYTIVTLGWDQHACDQACASDPSDANHEGPLVPPGSYTAVGRIDTADVDATGPSAPFTLRSS